MIYTVAYDKKKKAFRKDISASELPALLADKNTVLWADFENPSPDEVMVLGEVFHFDPLAIEDCVHPRQHPKLESFPDYHFFIVQGIVTSNNAEDPGRLVEIAGFLSDRYLVTFHNGAMNSITQARQRCENGNSRLKDSTAYLTHDILDTLIDHFLKRLDSYEDRFEVLETRLNQDPFVETAAAAYRQLSSEVSAIRRIGLKNQSVFNYLSNHALKFINANEARQFRDVYDHSVRIADMAEYYQHRLRDLLDVQFSLSASRTNRVVQFLTVFATIMLPLNVITGLYGMNFDRMPFLHETWGFWLIAGVMTLLVIVMLAAFRRRNWI